jgi:bile acid-coenzyme A ligase
MAPFTYCVTGLLDANTIIIPPRFEPAEAWKIIPRYGVQWLQLTPTHMSRMAASSSCGTESLSQVRGILHTAAFCPSETKRRWIELAGPSRIFELYGATEDIGYTLASGQEWLERPGTVGRGILTQIRILDERLRPLPTGTVGRVFMRRLRSPAGRSRYLGAVAPGTAGTGTAGAVLAEDGFRSVGDYGWLDDDGYLFLKSRREDMIIVAGKNVYLAEIENVIAEHPLVCDVAVLGAPDPVFGSKVVAVISTHGNQPLGLVDIIGHCQGRLAVHQMPQRVHQVTEVPRNEAGKIQRWSLPPAFWQDEQ